MVPLKEQLEAAEAALEAAPLPPILPPRVSDEDRTLAALKAIAMILSARALVFCVMFGGFALGAAALFWPDYKRLMVVIAYGVLVIGPAIFLEVKRR